MHNIFKSLQKNTRSDFWEIIGLFLIWRITLAVFLFVAVTFIPLGSTDRFLGGGLKNYLMSPEIFAWANFDGEHYLSLSIFGYKGLEQAFFPVYPGIISFVAHPFYGDFFAILSVSTFVGITISHVAFLLSLIILWELIRLDFPQKIARWTIVLLLFFPTSFFFASVYSESLFFLLVVGIFYSARKQKWLLAGLLGVIASATRVFGVLLLPALLIEIWQQKVPLRKSIWIFLTPLGLLGYMFYQWRLVGDPIAFYHLQKLVGEQHQSGFTLLPQVYSRYVKMLMSVSLSNPIYLTLILEFVTGLAFFLLPLYGYFKKVRLSYIFFALVGFLIPSVQGSLSSVPRYILVLFPGFMALAIYVDNLPKWLKLSLITILVLWLFIETLLFLRGYWVA